MGIDCSADAIWCRRSTCAKHLCANDVVNRLDREVETLLLGHELVKDPRRIGRHDRLRAAFETCRESGPHGQRGEIDDPKVGGEKRGRESSAAIRIPCGGPRRVPSSGSSPSPVHSPVSRPANDDGYPKGHSLEKFGSRERRDGSGPLLPKPAEAVL